MFSSTTFGERVQSGSYKRPNLAHSQTTAHPFPPLAASQPALTASQLPSSWSTSFSPQNSLSSSTRDGSGYLPGYLLSASQGMPLPEGSQRYEDPPLLPSKTSPYGSVSPGTFGAEDGVQHMSRQQPLDEDAPPTQSVLDEINNIPMGGDPFKTPIRNARHQRTATAREWHEVIIFGFPQDKLAAAMKLFGSLGDCQPPTPGPEGANWFKIGYKHEWEAARAVRKNGELINGAWMVGVKWAQDPKETWASPATSFMMSPLGDEPTSPTTQVVARTNLIGKPVALEPSSNAYRVHPGGASNAAGAGGEDWASAHAGAVAPGTPQKTKGLFGLMGW